MKVIIEFIDTELEDAVQQHLNGGVSVQTYIKSALRFFKEVRLWESKGQSIRLGNSNNMKRYNSILTTESYLNGHNTEPEDF